MTQVKVEVGVNDFATARPDLVVEWHPTLNGDLTPQDIYSGNATSRWWIDAEGHEWKAVPAVRLTQGLGCTNCRKAKAARERALERNALSKKHPEVAAMWHPTLNGDVTPAEVPSSSRDKYWWLGECGHEWDRPVSRQIIQTECLFCTGRHMLSGFNDFATKHPELSAEWHPTKNEGLLASEVSPVSNQKVWWLCKDCGHDWKVSVGSRTSGGTGCPACAEGSVATGVNDLATTHPHLLRFLTPVEQERATKVKAGSSRVFTWGCSKGHTWEASPKVVSKREDVCKMCLGLAEIKSSRDLQTLEAGAPALAELWSSELNGDLTPADVPVRSKKKHWFTCTSGHSYQATPQRAGHCPTCGNKTLLPGFNDLATLRPDLAVQWHPTKNDAEPEALLVTGDESYWWVCDKGHEWEASLSKRRRGSGCHVCTGQIVVPGVNDLATTHPDIAAEWHPIKNGTLTPSSVLAGTKTEVWWEGKCGHEWKSRAIVRLESSERNPDSVSQGCPVCDGKNITVGVNDLATTHPSLASEWHPTKNGDLTPQQTTRGRADRVWWKCQKGHEWVATPGTRTQGYGCKRCGMNGSSKEEQEIVAYLKTLGIKVEANVYQLLQPRSRMEVDIWLPQQRIGIEYNGLYHHSEAYKDSTYHHTKWLLAKQNNIQLIQIWSDEWQANPEQIKRMLAHKIGVGYGSEKKVMARKTQAVEINKATAEAFLEGHHIQGWSSGTHYLALVPKVAVGEEVNKSASDLLAVLVLKKEAGREGKSLNIIRYATSAVVPGGFTKLLKHAERTYQPDEFITFSDNCVSDGGLYQNNGFIADKELAPDYKYVVGRKRQHKFGYRLSRFKNDPTLKWEDGLTERELAKLNGLHRIWDAGKIRWVKTVASP